MHNSDRVESHHAELDEPASDATDTAAADDSEAPAGAVLWPQPRRDPYFGTEQGEMHLGDSAQLLAAAEPETVDLIVTSPPFALLRQKDYGNPPGDAYLEWFRPFAEQFHRVLKPEGSLVLDFGGSWVRGAPQRSLYHFKLLIMLCEEMGFCFAQDLYWWNPSKLPTPAEWVTVRRIRLKDAVNMLMWLSKSPWPKADNRRVMNPYSDAMRDLLRDGTTPALRPSGHDVSRNFERDNGAAISPNLIAAPHTDSNSAYLRYCRAHSIKPHPARFPPDVPEFFVRMLTDTSDLVLDPFAGSCTTGEVCERLTRRWVCLDAEEAYLRGAVGRFSAEPQPTPRPAQYRLPRPATLWDGPTAGRLDPRGGRLYRRDKHST